MINERGTDATGHRYLRMCTYSAMNETSTLKDFPLLYNSLESLDLPQHPNAIHHSQCAKLHKLSLFANLCRGVVIVTVVAACTCQKHDTNVSNHNSMCKSDGTMPFSLGCQKVMDYPESANGLSVRY